MLVLGSVSDCTRPQHGRKVDRRQQLSGRASIVADGA